MAKGKYEYWLTPDGLLLIEGWAREGLTDEQIAHNIGIAVGTLYAWKATYPEISEAIKKGKAPVDFQVENALLKRALGYEVTEERTDFKMKPGYDGKPIPDYETARVTRTKRHIPPDPLSIFYWLKNRKPLFWRDKPMPEVSADDDPLKKLIERLDREADSAKAGNADNAPEQ